MEADELVASQRLYWGCAAERLEIAWPNSVPRKVLKAR